MRDRQPRAVLLSPVVPATLAVLLLVISLVALGLRAPTESGLAIRGDVPDASDDVRASDTVSSVPPGSAPAPVPTPAATVDADPVPTPTAVDVSTDAEDGVAATDALVVPDDDTEPARVVAEAAPAPPAPPPTTPVGPGTGDTARDRFASRFPAHEAATQDPSDPASTRWALLIGINDHMGTVRNNVGSRQDAESLNAHLMDLGWQPDHVLVLTDRMATRENIVEGIHWLARKVDRDSLAVVSYSGHVKQWPGQDRDGDGEVTDEALWPTDDQFILDSEFVSLMDGVRPGTLWVNLMGCQAAGFLDPGLVQEGRIVSFSSAEDEKSYEDPSVGHSVWGWNLVVQGLRHGIADRDGDGDVTVQEAVAHAIPRSAHRTSQQQPYGPQNGGMVDQARGPVSLTIPAPPPPPEQESPDSGGDEQPSRDSGGQDGDAGEPEDDPEQEPEPERSPRPCILLCSSGRD